MATFETPAFQPDSNPNIDIPLPDGIDDDWCAMFTHAYGRTGKRVIVNTYSLMRQARQLYRCKTFGFRSFYEEDLGEVPEEGVFVDGEVLGARLVPIWDKFSEEYEYVAHIELTNVIDAHGERSFAYPQEEVWVPLTENGTELHLY
ncbi:MAG: hypothetical protein ACREGG_00590 [Candidatus Saccharimonadales bacterium]